MMLMFSCGFLLLTINAAFGCSRDVGLMFFEQAGRPCEVGHLSITYDTPVKCGAQLTTYATSSQPLVQYSNADPSLTYTLLMISSDDLMMTTDDELINLIVPLQWAVTGIQGSQIQSGHLPSSTISYEQPKPGSQQMYTYSHFIVFEEPIGRQVTIRPEVDRNNFDLGAFMTANRICYAVAMSQISVSFYQN